MGRKSGNGTDRARTVLAQEAARIIVEQGISDFRLAKHKAAERLGMSERGSLPGNSEIEQAVAEYQQLFLGDSHSSVLQTMRHAALAAMELLAAFTPRVAGGVLHGTAGAHSPVDLHVFSDSVEQVAFCLERGGVVYRPFDRRLKSRRGRSESFAGLRFLLMETPIEATVFPFDGIRQAPISPVDGRPMRRADARILRELLES
ncbi:MAG: hypothetical protein OEW35_14185 [Gammaproteobacteria bacterium]|nr:hypothetical protein [Gammaproteobacteria bacterium]MDH4256079.1 hypothetical protein [Gammaproteobacteria bacterium]MDH5311405.1 hypothetical protein [Gammaproteobacteria bacterium]